MADIYTAQTTVNGTSSLLYTNSSFDDQIVTVTDLDKPTPTYVWLKDGSTIDQAVDGSSTPVDYEYTVATGYSFDAERVIVFYQDAGTFDAGLYGNGTVLTNGIDVEVDDGAAGITDLLDGIPIKSNADWTAMCYDFSYLDIGTGDNTASIRWTFAKAGEPLHLPSGYTIRMSINDLLTGLTYHRTQLQGVLNQPAIYLGPSGVATSDGAKLRGEASFKLLPNRSLHAITATGTRNVELRVNDVTND